MWYACASSNSPDADATILDMPNGCNAMQSRSFSRIAQPYGIYCRTTYVN